MSCILARAPLLRILCSVRCFGPGITILRHEVLRDVLVLTTRWQVLLTLRIVAPPRLMGTTQPVLYLILRSGLNPLVDTPFWRTTYYRQGSPSFRLFRPTLRVPLGRRSPKAISWRSIISKPDAFRTSLRGLTRLMLQSMLRAISCLR